MQTTLRIDGSHGEGGGQIVRTCLSLSAITGQPVEIVNMRAGRSKPGLQPQHLMAVHAAAEICNARLEGDSQGSTRLSFTPQESTRAGDYRFEIKTAGAAPLVAQTVLIPLTLAGGESGVVITGGTHVPHAPPADYLESVNLPVLNRSGIEAEAEYARAGFYPRGGGEIHLRIRPANHIRPLDLTERGKLVRLRAFVVTAGLPDHVMERGAATVERFMKGVGRKIELVRRDRESPGAGAAVVITAECEGGFGGFTSLGERGKPMEKVAEDACEQFMAWWKTGAAVDEHLADQLVLPLALAVGESRWSTPRITEHLRTVLWVVNQFLPVESSLEDRTDGGGIVMTRGAGPNPGSSEPS